MDVTRISGKGATPTKANEDPLKKEALKGKELGKIVGGQVPNVSPLTSDQVSRRAPAAKKIQAFGKNWFGG